ncbi:MAG: hypothetical protein KAT77_04025 [Nanoarchaeota archaeon]|nr:hypothetical protein [Nanoarchaeota archaeon]
MEPINSLLVFLVALTGYLLGVGLSYIAPEELKPGFRYFLWLERGLFVLTFLPIIYVFGLSTWVMIPVAIALVSLFLNVKYRIYGSFGLFLVWFFLVWEENLIVVLLASAIFVYGLVAGTLALEDLSPSRMAKLNKKVKV